MKRGFADPRGGGKDIIAGNKGMGCKYFFEGGGFAREKRKKGLIRKNLFRKKKRGKPSNQKRGSGKKKNENFD